MPNVIDMLLVDFSNAAITYGEELDTGNSRAAIKANRAAQKVYNDLKSLGEEHRILDLLDFANPAVRLMAATKALKIEPKRGEVVLEKLSQGPSGGVNAMAYTALLMWRKDQAAT